MLEMLFIELQDHKPEETQRMISQEPVLSVNLGPSCKYALYATVIMVLNSPNLLRL